MQRVVSHDYVSTEDLQFLMTTLREAADVNTDHAKKTAHHICGQPQASLNAQSALSGDVHSERSSAGLLGRAMYKLGNNDQTQLPLTKWMTGIAGSLWARKHFLCQVSPNLKGTLALLRSSGTGRPVGKQMQSIWHSRTPHPAIRNVRTKNCHNLRSNPCNVTFDVSTTKLQLLMTILG